VASHLFGKPPNPRRGTSWKRRQTFPLHIPSCRWLPSKGECSDGKDEGNVLKTSPFSHTPL